MNYDQMIRFYDVAVDLADDSLNPEEILSACEQEALAELGGDYDRDAFIAWRDRIFYAEVHVQS